MQNELSGVHVKLLPLNLNHAENLFQAGSDPTIWERLPRDVFTSLDDTKNWVEERLNTAKSQTFTIFNHANEVLGSSSYLDIDVVNKSLEIGYTWLNPNVWRTAVNTECKFLLLRNAFDVLNYKRVFFKTDTRNIRSQKAIERLGAKKEGVFRSAMRLSETFWRDSVYYSIIDFEWPDVKAKLNANA